MTISGHESKTNWERVPRSIEMDKPIPNDPDDDQAVDAFFKQATI
jgi:hypothetical protein